MDLITIIITTLEPQNFFSFFLKGLEIDYFNIYYFMFCSEHSILQFHVLYIISYKMDLIRRIFTIFISH